MMETQFLGVQMPVNRNWWQNKLADAQMSQRELAIKHLGLDPASFSKCLSGSRKLQLGEAVKIAQVFNCDLNEVLNAFGLIDRKVENSVNVDGYFSAMGVVSQITESIRVPKLSETIGNTFALQYRDEKASAIDAWMFYFSNKAQPVEVGKPALFVAENGAKYVGYAQRGYIPGEYRIVGALNNMTLATIKANDMHLLVGVTPPM